MHARDLKIENKFQVYPEKIQNIVLDVSKLTLLEVADLNELLRKTLNIPDAPVMAFGAAMGSPAAAKCWLKSPPWEEEEEEEEVAAPAKVQTNFTLKMNKFDATKKVPLIKEVKAKLEGFNLVQHKQSAWSTLHQSWQGVATYDACLVLVFMPILLLETLGARADIAKKFVESCPCVVKSDIPKDEAEALLEAFKAVGADKTFAAESGYTRGPLESPRLMSQRTEKLIKLFVVTDPPGYVVSGHSLSGLKNHNANYFTE
ncbi:39S ribosomal protein L12, mitochondrial [Chionoecetes opilio]|uniref:39S ribosomal protein L12, mitochondrial n=1 Tax=Chionoecetes opilio TaxID=41210 RepID=A0A8J4YL01_CHIOP|nr:39S ribosomal protein L12, mitochondrial [Chionoecetes opilio]